MILRVFSVCCALLASFTALADAQYVDVASASLSKAPVGFYSRRNIYGEAESASSLSGAPVGMYSKRHFPQIPFVFPQVYPYPFLPFLSLPQYGGYVPPKIPYQPIKPIKKQPVVVRPPVVKPPVYKPSVVRTPLPKSSAYVPPGGVSGRFMGGLLGGGLLGGGGGLLGGLL